MISKTDLRKQLIEKRKTLDTRVLSDLICQNIEKTTQFQIAKNIFAYYPKPFEVDITPLFKNKKKNWFLPKTVGENLQFFKYKSGDELILGEFRVMEPKTDIPTKIIPDLIIVPALSVDKRGFRLGYGKGFYDRFLAEFMDEKPLTLTPLFSDLLTDFLPCESYDKKIEVLVTENT